MHKVPTPGWVALAMFGGMAAGLLAASHLPWSASALSLEQSGQTTSALLAAGGLIVVTGFLDDWLGMDALVKLGGQAPPGACCSTTACRCGRCRCPRAYKGGNVFLDLNLQAVMTIRVVVVVAINAVNFVDGLDGLAARHRRHRGPGHAGLLDGLRSRDQQQNPHQPDRRGSRPCWSGCAWSFLPHGLQPGQDLHG